MSGRKRLRLREVLDLAVMRAIGAEPKHVAIAERYEQLPTRGEVESRLDDIRAKKKPTKKEFEEALWLVQALTLLDMWELANTAQTFSVMRGVEQAMTEADKLSGKGKENGGD